MADEVERFQILGDLGLAATDAAAAELGRLLSGPAQRSRRSKLLTHRHAAGEIDRPAYLRALRDLSREATADAILLTELLAPVAKAGSLRHLSRIDPDGPGFGPQPALAGGTTGRAAPASPPGLIPPGSVARWNAAEGRYSTKNDPEIKADIAKTDTVTFDAKLEAEPKRPLHARQGSDRRAQYDQEYNAWFKTLTKEEITRIQYEEPGVWKRIEDRIRGAGGGNHEWLPATMTADLVAIGFGPDELFDLSFARTDTLSANFRVPRSVAAPFEGEGIFFPKAFSHRQKTGNAPIALSILHRDIALIIDEERRMLERVVSRNTVSLETAQSIARDRVLMRIGEIARDWLVDGVDKQRGLL